LKPPIANVLNLILPIEPQFYFKRFQREDYARAALHDGLILAHDTGLGKSVAVSLGRS
jgi:hypothetical protein